MNALPRLPRPVFPRAARHARRGDPQRDRPRCSYRSAAARTRSSRSRSSGAPALDSRCSPSATDPDAAHRRGGRRSAARRRRARLPLERSAPERCGRAQRARPDHRDRRCVALLTAALNGYDAVAMANERSASPGTSSTTASRSTTSSPRARAPRRCCAPRWPRRRGGRTSSRCCARRPSSRIARPFARLDAYHDAFTSCNPIFRLDPALRAASWCRDCPKCRFVFLMLAPFMDPEALARDLRRGDARRRAAVRGLRAADRDRRAQAVRVRRRGGRVACGDRAARRA